MKEFVWIKPVSASTVNGFVTIVPSNPFVCNKLAVAPAPTVVTKENAIPASKAWACVFVKGVPFVKNVPEFPACAVLFVNVPTNEMFVAVDAPTKLLDVAVVFVSVPTMFPAVRLVRPEPLPVIAPEI